MSKTVLITGGAGFVGSHIVDKLIGNGYDVIVLDSLVEQVHYGEIPDYLNEEAEFVEGDVRDDDVLRSVVDRADIINHQAAAVGVGQSMYEVEKYVDVNELGTAKILDLLVEDNISVEKFIIASSMSIYGEGSYYCPKCEAVQYTVHRPESQLTKHKWEMQCPECGTETDPRPISESKPPNPTSIYAITKRNQEEMALTIGREYDIPTVALRYFNIYGSRQSLENPYTGVCAIFSSRIKNGNPPVIFEDGDQVRDFIHVSDIARANRLAIESNDASGEVVNIGTGTPNSIRETAEALIDLYDADLEPKVTDEYRAGDIRHAYADTKRAEELLGFESEVTLSDGLEEFVRWSEGIDPDDSFDEALEELEEKGLVGSDE